MELLHSRNPRASQRFDGIATQYMRIGEELGIRWDLAFFQMMLETGALSFTGDVRADQNNFAGLGASGGGKRGERFPDIATGVKAHLQHLMMYAGEHIDDPVAERTRKVQEWGVLTDWQNSISGPMTFSLIGQQWAPGSRSYVRDIATIKDEFYTRFCNAPDPEPELVQEARKGRLTQTQIATNVPPAVNQAAAVATPEPDTSKGAVIAQKTIAEERKENPPRSALGAGMLGSVAATAKAAASAANKPAPEAQSQQVQSQQAQPAVTVLNSTEQKTAPETPKTKPDASTGGASIQTASVAGAATQLKTPAAKSAAKCKVWTASYGGQRAIIIKATTDGTDNYTVLDVNETSQKREVEAYIAAYAKGGKQIGAFSNQTKALDKAFELCPEG